MIENNYLNLIIPYISLRPSLYIYIKYVKNRSINYKNSIPSKYKNKEKIRFVFCLKRH